jgi:CHAT domain-containing protein
MPRRFRAHLVWAILAAGCLLAVTEAAGEEVSLAGCQAAFTAAPEVESSSWCFERAVWAGASTRIAARRRMEELLADNSDQAWLAFYLGNLYWGEPAAETWYRRAAERFAELGEARGEARSHFNLYQVLSDRNATEEAEAELARAHEIAERSDDPALIAMCQLEEARQLVLRQTGFDRAYSLLRQAGRAVFTKGWYGLQKAWLSTFGTLVLNLERWEEANRTFRELDGLTSRAGDRLGEANAKYNRVRVLIRQAAEEMDDDLRAEIRQLAEEALAAAQAGGNTLVEAEAELVLGGMAEGEEAIAHFARCSKATRYPWLQAPCLAGMARRLATEDPVRARRLLDRALRLTADDPWAQADVLTDRMRVSWVIDPPEQAKAEARQALAAIEALRRRQKDRAVAAGVSSRWADNYYLLIGRLLEQGGDADLAQAFEVAEQMRARSLREALEAAASQPALHEEKFASGDRHVATLAEVQGSLAPNEAFLYFLVAPDVDWTGDFGGGSWLLATTTRGTRAYRLRHDRATLRGATSLLNGSLRAHDGRETPLSVQLYDLLLGPALAELPPEIDRLVLVPDGALHGLPFATLRKATHAEFLTLRYRLSQAPSATLWRDWRRTRPASPAVPGLALADPPLARNGGEAVLTPVERGGLSSTPLRLRQLPFARREAAAVRRALGFSTVLREGAEASEYFLKHTDLSRFGVVHLATHSYMNEQYPEASAVLLARGAPGEDGWLLPGEIARLNLDGRVVVLASCRGASGRLLRGEGLLSLARAFFEARARTVVANLRPLRDDYAQELFSRFYDHLAEGRSVADALSAAQRDRIDDGAPAAAWAEMVVLGDGDLIPFPGGRPWLARHAAELTACAGALLLLGILVALAGGPRPGRRRA